MFGSQKSPKLEPQVGPVVHETEAQRQYVRVRMPAFLRLAGKNEGRPCRVLDVSAGGMLLDPGRESISTRKLQRGQLRINIDEIEFGINVGFKVLREHDDGSLGCRFEELGAAEVDALRQIISAFISGELVSVGEMLQTLNRNNQSRMRSTARPIPRPGFHRRLQALFGTSAILVVGVIAFTVVLLKLHDYLMLAPARSAHIQGPSHSIAMPREGIIRSLVPDDGVVERGAPIASFETAMLELVRSEALAANLSPERINELLEEKVTGTITSPCDCVVKAQLIPDGQYVSKGEPLFELAPLEFEPQLVAGFSFDDAEPIRPRSRVSFRVAGESKQRQGEVISVRNAKPSDAINGEVMVVVKPDEPLPASLIDRPAEVSVNRWPMLAGLLDSVPSATAGDEGEE